MNFPCGNPLNCEGVESPTANLSAELPDRRHFFGYNFFPDQAVLCDADTQELADICNALPPTNPPIPTIYSSNAQTCTLRCADGSTESYTIAAGTVVALTQADADNQAFAFACLLAQILCDSGTIHTFTNTAQACSVSCPDGSTFNYTVAAGLFTALSQSEANSNALIFACELAALLCSGIPPFPIPGEPPPQPESPRWANAPQTCTWNCPDGSVFFYTVAAGLFVADSAADANSRANAYACRQAAIHHVCLGSIQSEACADTLYSQSFTAENIAPPATFTLTSGALPPGLIIFGQSLVGYPSAGGTYTFTIRATGSDGNYIERQYSIRVLEIDPVSLPNGDTASAYAQALSTVGEVGTIVWSIVDGALPEGLTLNSNTGVISGVPTVAGTFTFTVLASETN
jgi:phage baseplate assembly protein gpV